MTMTHPGLPIAWAITAGLFMLAFTCWSFITPARVSLNRPTVSLANIAWLGPLFRYLVSQTRVLLILKVVFVGLFLLIIVAGLWGSPIAERNISTVLTWNLWWTGVIISVWFFGTSWCAVCPWDTIANWLVRHQMWRKSISSVQLNLRVPSAFRSLWSALFMLTFLTWLELGVGVTSSPYATASLALMMVVLSTLALVIYRDKAFCRYFCPVGRTIGVYSQLSPIALRPIDQDICQSCPTLDCYHGNDTIEPCPTNLVMGRLQESTYCISCGNCTQSCPSNNINWQLRLPNTEAELDARPHDDEAGFMIGLLGLSSFHGITMLPLWPQLISQLARILGDSGTLIYTFTILLTIHMVAVFIIYLIFVFMTKILIQESSPQKIFSNFAFASLPIAFAYHVAHNLNHLFRESGNLQSVFLNPLGLDTQPLSMVEKHQRAMDLITSTEVIWVLQCVFLVLGFCLSMQVLKYRGSQIFSAKDIQLLPMVVFCALMTGGSLWLLCQPMMMRM